MNLEKKQQSLIEQLIPLCMEPRFHEVFDRLLADESQSNRFLIKMELSRLTSECIRIIDLRDRTELSCMEFSTGKQRHYIDEFTKEAFKQALTKYQGIYTTGVYEQVIASIKEKRRLTQQERQSSTATLSHPDKLVPAVNFGHYRQRTEERMNYSIKILISQPSGLSINAVTLDISVTGARIRLPIEHQLDLSSLIYIRFIDLEKEFCFEELEQALAYEVTSKSAMDKHLILGLKRLEGSQAFSNMLSNLITGYKFRYKVNITDLHDNIPGLNIEQHYLANMPHVPLFVSSKKEQYVLSHELLSQKNRDTLNYFLDENDISQLPSLFTPLRLAALLSPDATIDDTLFYCFTYNIKGRLFFYSASLAELKQQDHVALFFNFGAAKASWRVFHVSSQVICHQNSYKNNILPGENSDYSSLTRRQIQMFSHQLLLSDVSNQAEQHQYQAWPQGLNPNLLKQFLQPKSPKNRIRAVTLQEKDKRQETRFVLKTLVTIKQSGIRAQGMTLDISSKGLQISLDDSTEFKLDEPILLCFPKLQKLSKKNKLDQLPYKLIRARSGNTLLHVSAISKNDAPHQGVEFLQRLIESNKTKLTSLSELSPQFREIADGLKNLALRQLTPLPFIIEKHNKTLCISALAINSVNSTLANHFKASTGKQTKRDAGTGTENNYDLSHLLNLDRFHKLIIEPLSSLEPKDPMTFTELFICRTDNQQQGRANIQCVTIDELSSINAQAQFIKKAKIKGEFLALRLGIAACNVTSLKHVKQELDYLCVHAPHKAKKLEDKLWNTLGVGELMDVTHEVLQRYHSLYIPLEKSA